MESDEDTATIVALLLVKKKKENGKNIRESKTSAGEEN